MSESTRSPGEGGSVALPDEERRRAARFRIARDARCYPYQDDRFQRHDAELYDISATGVGVVSSHSFEVGALVILDLPLPVPGFPYGLSARVIRAVSREDGRWFLGCTFPRPLPPRTVQALLG